MEKVATKQNDLENGHALGLLSSDQHSVVLYEAAQDLLEIEKALGVPPGSPIMFTDPSTCVCDSTTAPLSSNVLTTDTVCAPSLFTKYCYEDTKTKQTVYSPFNDSTSKGASFVKERATQRSVASKASGCGQCSQVSTNNRVRAAGLKRPPPGSKPLHNISNLRQ